MLGLRQLAGVVKVECNRELIFAGCHWWYPRMCGYLGRETAISIAHMIRRKPGLSASAWDLTSHIYGFMV